MFKKGNRVCMINNDPWADRGWTGEIIATKEGGQKVKWDNGKNFWHRNNDLSIIGGKIEPNVAFIMHKHRRQR